ncbi:MAG: acetyltransferase [Salinivirgaceae bacterium]|nr:acetyltransferase [Salinivirgaceae bacterium]
MKNKKLIIYGSGETAEIAADYFIHDSDYEVIAFTVDKQYLTDNKLMNLPVVDFEEVEKNYPPNKVEIFVAASFGQLNRIRTGMYEKAKAKGYRCASFISSRAFVWHNVEIGENVFIFENNVVQYKAKIGNNVILWSGNHIGHQTVIEDNCFVSSHVVISGFCRIGENSFLGVNSSFNDGIKFGKDGVTGNGTVIVKDTEPGMVWVGNPAKAIKSSYEAFKIE